MTYPSPLFEVGAWLRVLYLQLVFAPTCVHACSAPINTNSHCAR